MTRAVRSPSVNEGDRLPRVRFELDAVDSDEVAVMRVSSVVDGDDVEGGGRCSTAELWSKMGTAPRLLAWN